MNKILLSLILLTTFSTYSQIQAVSETLSIAVEENTGGSTTGSVLSNDLLNGSTIALSDINLTTISAPAGFILNPNGTITVAGEIASGNYNLTYQICQKSNPTNCATATVTIMPTRAIRIADLTGCDGYYVLTNQYPLLLGNLDPNKTTISYHFTNSDATNGVNTIANPEQLQSFWTRQIIYARVNNLGVITTYYFQLSVPFLPIGINSTDVHNATELGKNDGSIVFTFFNPLQLNNIRPLLINVSSDNVVGHWFDDNPLKLVFFNNLAPGTYQLRIQIPCQEDVTSDPITIIAATPLQLKTTIIDKTITANATGGIPPYFYSIDDIYHYNSNNVFPGLTVGKHTITVVDSNSTYESAYVTIPETLTATTTSSNVKCYGDNNGSITITAAGGNPPYTYSKDGNNYSQSNTFNNLAAGTHTIYTKDANGVVVNNVSTITQPATPLSTTAATTNVACSNNGSIIIKAIGGTAPYSYSIDGVNYDSTSTFSNLVTGTYTLYAKDSNGCISTQLVTLDQPAPLFITASVKNFNCYGSKDGSITLTTTGGSGSYVYSINGSATQNSNVFTGLTAGIYILIATDSKNGCTTTTSVSITEPTVLNTTTAITNITCSNNGSITINATGGTAPYSYSKDRLTFVQSNIFDNLITGTYTTYVKDTNGCISQNSTVISPLVPLYTTITKTDVLCKGSNDGSITVNAWGGKSPYVYSRDNGATYVSSNAFINLIAGTYNIIVKDINNCTLPMNVTIGEPALLSMTVAITKPIDCISNAIATVTATGGQAPYSYSKDGVNYDSTSTFSNLISGAYSLYTKDSNGCLSIQSVKLDQPTPLSITPSVKNLNCKGSKDGSITLTTTGGSGSYYYSINGGATQNSNVFSGLSAGTYAITATDTNSCTATITVTITEPAPLQTTILIDNQTITVNTLGGTAPYQYSIDGLPYLTGNTISNVAPGIISINTRDAKGCITTSTNNVVYPPIPKINGNIVITISFKYGQTLGDIILEIQNMKWYLSLSASTSKTSKITEDPLPLSTLIQNNATYYVSQTINGVESIERLTVHFSESTLETPRFDLSNFTYYPNPVKDIFTISNTAVIDEATLISIKGQTLLTKKINSLHSEIDLSNLSKGLYLLKIKSGGAEKTVKIIKE